MSGSDDGRIIDKIINDGKIVPVTITIKLIKDAIMKYNNDLFLIDGFPRNQDNLLGWEENMSNICDVEATIFVDCPEEELQKRLLLRGLTSGRTDDNIETAKKRFITYKDVTMPIINYYDSISKLIRVRGDRNIDEVFNDIRDKIKPLIEKKIVENTQMLLDSISTNDFMTYETLCDVSLTCFEEKANGNLVQGLEFHKFYVDVTTSKEETKNKSTMHDSIVHVTGKSALITYIKGKKDIASGKIDKFKETRIWELINGTWKHVHCTSNIIKF